MDNYYKITIKSSGKPHCTVDTLYRTAQQIEDLAYNSGYNGYSNGHEAMISYLAEKLSDSKQYWWCEAVTGDEYLNAASTIDWVRTIEKSV